MQLGLVKGICNKMRKLYLQMSQGRRILGTCEQVGDEAGAKIGIVLMIIKAIQFGGNTGKEAALGE